MPDITEAMREAIAPTAAVYPLGWIDPDSDRPISVGLALK